MLIGTSVHLRFICTDREEVGKRIMPSPRFRRSYGKIGDCQQKRNSNLKLILTRPRYLLKLYIDHRNQNRHAQVYVYQTRTDSEGKVRIHFEADLLRKEDRLQHRKMA